MIPAINALSVNGVGVSLDANLYFSFDIRGLNFGLLVKFVGLRVSFAIDSSEEIVERE